MGVDHIIGELFDGRYRLERRIGTGGMADVYLAEDETLHRQVAIKILADRYTQDEGFVERFRREATAAAGLNHPNIVSIYDRGECDGTYYIAMEYIDGPTLKEEITSRAPLPEAEAVGYAQQVLQALEFAHRRGVIHRDIKPHNMMLTEDGLLKVTDFGIARAANQVEMTEVGSIVGTAQYLSPEQARGQTVGPQSDIYSLGVVLYEMLTGEVPFTGSSAVEIAMKQVNERPVPPSQKNRLISPAVEAIVMRALAKDPAMRFRSAREMADELERARRGLGVSQDTQQATQVIGAYEAAGATQVMGAAPTGVMTAGGGPPPQQQPRRSALPWILVLLLLIASAVVGYIVYQQLQTDQVKVPNVAGFTELQAKSQLQQAGFTTATERKASKTVPAGTVIGTDPPGGSEADKGSQVTILLSTGPKSVKLPDLHGKPLSQALQTLADLGLSANPVQIPSKLQSGLVV
ncbi:MAG TPA: Stk1 family PASTA domain-containing Ser/Thr kinase, partial [Gaiellales bacterium]|nr:Stk1 family PASTA domain-containing Ser/Thr kinase [Gaiellales bacterium]